MLRDITIGQHFPGNSIVHRLDPRIKIVLTLAYIIVLLIGTNPLGLTVAVLFLIFVYALSKIPPRMIWRSIRPLLPILVFTAVLNLFFTTSVTEVPLFQLGFITIYRESIYHAISIAIRIVALLIGTSLLTYTTSPIVLTDAIERLLSPLARFGFPAHELAMMMTIALRMIPTLIEETDKIMNAQKARGAELDSGGFVQRVKALVPVLIPMFLSAFRRADELALAMEARCYHGGEGRTRLRQLHITKEDIVAAVVCGVVIVLIGFSSRIWAAIPF